MDLDVWLVCVCVVGRSEGKDLCTLCTFGSTVLGAHRCRYHERCTWVKCVHM